MAETYTIKAVKQTPKEWESDYGKFKTWLIQVEGNGEPVQLNKKADSPTPQIGDELYGTITETEYGQKFKSERKPFGGSQGGYQKSPEDRDSIYRCNALNNSVAYVVGLDRGLAKPLDALAIANDFYAWLKGDSPSTPAKEPEPEGGWETARKILTKDKEPPEPGWD